jgi:hypothetical protein
MAVETLPISPPSASPWRRPLAMRWPLGRLTARLRLLRRAQARRALLALVLAETSDPRLIEDAGLRPPGPSLLDLWARSLLGHRR